MEHRKDVKVTIIEKLLIEVSRLGLGESLAITKWFRGFWDTGLQVTSCVGRSILPALVLPPPNLCATGNQPAKCNLLILSSLTVPGPHTFPCLTHPDMPCAGSQVTTARAS